jgi:hypothetical protein
MVSWMTVYRNVGVEDSHLLGGEHRYVPRTAFRIMEHAIRQAGTRRPPDIAWVAVPCFPAHEVVRRHDPHRYGNGGTEARVVRERIGNSANVFMARLEGASRRGAAGAAAVPQNEVRVAEIAHRRADSLLEFLETALVSLLSGNREKKPAGEKLPLGRTGSEGSDQMSFEDRVKARLKLWIERNPGAPKDAVDRKARSIARRLREEQQEAEDVTSASDRRMSQ